MGRPVRERPCRCVPRRPPAAAGAASLFLAMATSRSNCRSETRCASIGCLAWTARSMARRTSTDFSSRSETSTVTGIVPLRSSSSSVSRLWVKEAISVNPKVALPPLIECATRKMVLMSSGSGEPTIELQQRRLHGIQRLEALLEECVVKLCQVDCHRSTSPPKLEHVVEPEKSGRGVERGRPSAPLDGAARRAAIAHEGGKELQSGRIDALQCAHVQDDGLGLPQAASELRFESVRLGYGAIGGQRQRAVRLAAAARARLRRGAFAAGGVSLAWRGAALEPAARGLPRRRLLLAGCHNLVGAQFPGVTAGTAPVSARVTRLLSCAL